MRIQEIDDSISAELAEGPLDWAWKSSKLGQWWDSRKGKAQQRDIAVGLINMFSKWRGFTGVKEITPKALTAWMASSETQSGLGLDANRAKQLMLSVAKPAFGANVKASMPLNNNQVKNFIIAISRVEDLSGAGDTTDQPSTTAPTAGTAPDLSVVSGGTDAGRAAAG